MTASFDRQLVDALPRLRRYALSLTREADAAGDLVQVAAVHALATSERPSDASAVLPWLIRIARNAFVDERRRNQHRTCESLSADLHGPTPDAERLISLRQALAALRPDCRDVVMLVDVEGRTYREAADRLGVPIGTVMSRLSRARSQLLSSLLGGEP